MTQENNFFHLFPVITLDNIVLREINPKEDYISYLNYITKSEVTDYLSIKDIPTNEDESLNELNYWRNLFRFHNSIYWAIALKQSNEIIGTCGFNYWIKEHNRAEISYDLSPSFWGKGIMTKALTQIVQLAVDEMKINRIQATVAVDNFRSIKILEKLNFKKEAVLKSYCILNNIPKDFYMYAIVN